MTFHDVVLISKKVNETIKRQKERKKFIQISFDFVIKPKFMREQHRKKTISYSLIGIFIFVGVHVKIEEMNAEAIKNILSVYGNV